MGKAKQGDATTKVNTEVIPMPIPKGRKAPKKKDTAQVEWKSEAIPMPIDRKPRPKKQ